MKKPSAKYRCMSGRCGFAWSGYRVLFHRCADTGPARWRCAEPCPMKGKPVRHKGWGMTECPKCEGIYVEWVNWGKCRKSLGEYWRRR